MQLEAVRNPPFDELAMAYERGLLTPFTGAGLSRGACPGWLQFVKDLEEAADAKGDGGETPAELIRRAWRAVQVLRHQSSDALERAVHRSLYSRLDAGECVLPPQTRALAELWWPLVLTTNYDSLFLDAWIERWVRRGDPLPDFNRMTILGRGRADCQRVLNATRGPDNPILWALQGFVSHSVITPRELVDQITIGHEEYRRQTHEAVHFRRAFAEIYRSRVLLFIGSGLQETYLLDLFGEALELLGTIGHFHYALVPKGATDPTFLQRRLQIRAIEYEPTNANQQSDCVREFLVGLKRAIDGPRAKPPSWALLLNASGTISNKERPDITVVRSTLPPPQNGDAVALSAGLAEDHTREKPRLLLGKPAKQCLLDRNLESADMALRPLQKYVYRVEGHSIFIVAARDPDLSKQDARDARHVAPAVKELMNAATTAGFKRVNAMLLAAGSHRTFPQYISLYGMVRGYCDWHRNTAANASIPLYIHIVDPSVIGLLESRRIDLAVMAGSSEVRFWIEIQFDGKSVAPELGIASIESPVADILSEYAIPSTGWHVSVRPAPTKSYKATRVEALLREQHPPTLAQFGVLNGSTLILTRSAF
ncbi:SIR2 family protein [Bradyrhizobium sp. Ai1a-2]|uniref:SIR2 family NAD-dependent protein deacylase n=1 Tax=Bradyrhizobium sp. Ai1a-2 TaxID=196490 RepID=UPI0004050062|nr:SIR2 family protein [Bradyrhizobium sp. Ai1a-2]